MQENELQYLLPSPLTKRKVLKEYICRGFLLTGADRSNFLDQFSGSTQGELVQRSGGGSREHLANTCRCPSYSTGTPEKERDHSFSA